MAEKIKVNVSEDNVRDLYRDARECLRRLKHLAKEVGYLHYTLVLIGVITESVC